MWNLELIPPNIMAGFLRAAGIHFRVLLPLFFVFRLSFWHIYVLSWAQAVLLPYRLSIVSFGGLQKELAFSREKENTEWKRNGIKGLNVSCLPCVCVCNLYQGQCFIQIDFFKLNVHVPAVQNRLSAYLCIVKQVSSYQHNGIRRWLHMD